MNQWNDHDPVLIADPADHFRRPGQGYVPRRGRLATLIMSLIGMTAVVGVGLLMFSRPGRDSETGVPLIQADHKPTKMKPDQPGGMAVPHQDVLVYDRLDPESAPPVIERILPGPEAPLPRPQAPPPQALTPPPAAFPPPPATGTGPGPGPGTPPAVGQTPTATATPPKPQPAKPPQPAVPKPPPAMPGLSAFTPSTGAALSPPVQPRPIPPAAVAAGLTPGGALGGPATSGSASFRVQLGSLKSEADATAEWRRLATRYPAQLGGLSPSIMRADLGEKGIYFRLRGGPLDENRAKDTCAQLKTQNVVCQVVRN
ncbi:Cell division septation protein DedD [uncultured Gammaproteobacteria bacterium]